MNIPNSKRSKTKRNIIIALVLALVIIGTVIWYAQAQNIGPFEEAVETSSGQTGQTQSTDSSDDSTTIGTENPSYDPENPARDNTTEPDDTNQPTSSAVINIPNYQADDGRILLNVAISEPWGSEARCTMQISGPVDRTVTESVFPQAQNSGCPLEATGLPVGSYQLTVFAENGTARTDTKKINVELK